MARPRTKNKDNSRRAKKRVSILTQEKVTYVDYKDVNLLRRFQSDRAKIRARRVTGNSAQQQSDIANAIKNAREMALLPYTNRVTQQRGSGRGRDGDRRRDDDRDDRDDVNDTRDDELDDDFDADLDAGGAEDTGADDADGDVAGLDEEDDE